MHLIFSQCFAIIFSCLVFHLLYLPLNFFSSSPFLYLFVDTTDYLVSKLFLFYLLPIMSVFYCLLGLGIFIIYREGHTCKTWFRQCIKIDACIRDAEDKISPFEGDGPEKSKTYWYEIYVELFPESSHMIFCLLLTLFRFVCINSFYAG